MVYNVPPIKARGVTDQRFHRSTPAKEYETWVVVFSLRKAYAFLVLKLRLPQKFADWEIRLYKSGFVLS